MKVYVTQGHERGIGLEVFFKSVLLLSNRDRNRLVLIASKNSVRETLAPLHLPHEIEADHIVLAGLSISTLWIEATDTSLSFTALKKGMSLAEQGGILYTLPTSKDQFPGFAGHTEYFRHHYKKTELGMFFSSPKLQVLLLSDHIPVADLSTYLTAQLIEGRLREALQTFARWKWPIERVLISGINPHAGEGGLIGKEDERVGVSIKRLRPDFQIEMSGPLPGDTMLLEQKSVRDLLVYNFHDQGLAVFKGLQGFIGSNITLGLPYPRFSPDHGTSFKLFGKNIADYRGCAYSLREALSLIERIANGKDSGHQSQGT